MAEGEPIDDCRWMAAAECRGQSSVMFPDGGFGVHAARQICAGCPVVAPCLEYALDNHIQHGVWGGESERSRRRMLKLRRQAAA